MKKDKDKFQIGDIIYEASVSQGQVIEWTIIDIFAEQDDEGWVPVFVLKSNLLDRSERKFDGMIGLLDRKESAEKLLALKRK